MTEHSFSSPHLTTDNLTSLQTHILAEEHEHPGATGDLSWILSAIALAAKVIANKVQRARVEDVLGSMGTENSTGDVQQKLDVIANEIIMRCLGDRANIGVLASEEDDKPIILRSKAEGGHYAVLFDPLDGSSNLDVSVGVGTIFSILRTTDIKPDTPEDLILQPGTLQVAAGYILYGSSVVFMLTTGRGVNMFVLDHSMGAFVLVKPKLKIPTANKIYSINEAYYDSFPQGYQHYLDWAHKNGYSGRYIGSMVADIHRTLLKGGVFLYPPTESHPEGKLRLMYEANPMAMILEQAGGKAISGDKRTLDIQPTGLHQRTNVLMGSPTEVDLVLKHVDES